MGRKREFDVLRALACLGVVYLHVAAPALRQFDDMLTWHVSNLLTALCTAAVPIFFMMSGALALGRKKTEDLADLFRRRLWRVLIPFAVWTLLMLGYYWWREGAGFALKKAEGLLYAPVTTPYWFLYGYLPLLLIAPFLQKMTDGMSEKHWRYLLGLWLAFSVLPQTLRAFLPWSVSSNIRWFPGYSLNFLGGMLGYFLLGAWLARVEIKQKPWKFVLAVLVLTLLIAGGTWLASMHRGEYSEQFKSYLSLFVVLLAVTLFLLIRAVVEAYPQRGNGRLWRILANASFGVYLSHPIVMDVLRHVLSGDSLLKIDSLGIQMGYFALVAAASVFVSVAAQKIPVIGYLLCGNTREKG